MIDHLAQKITMWFIILAPLIIIGIDILFRLVFGYPSTITAVFREWNGKHLWIEWIYVLFVLILYLHLFRNLG